MLKRHTGRKYLAKNENGITMHKIQRNVLTWLENPLLIYETYLDAFSFFFFFFLEVIASISACPTLSNNSKN